MGFANVTCFVVHGLPVISLVSWTEVLRDFKKTESTGYGCVCQDGLVCGGFRGLCTWRAWGVFKRMAEGEDTGEIGRGDGSMGEVVGRTLLGPCQET